MAGAGDVYETGRQPFKPQTVLLRAEASAVGLNSICSAMIGTVSAVIGIREMTTLEPTPGSPE
jgi:hypothetical protein